MKVQDEFPYDSSQGTRRPGYFRLAVIASACFVLMGCAGPNAPTTLASSDRGPAKCPPHVGQAESEFLRCGCFWDDASPRENVWLMSQAQTKAGSKKVYSCEDVGAYNYTVTVVNGKVSDLSGPSR